MLFAAAVIVCALSVSGQSDSSTIILSPSASASPTTTPSLTTNTSLPTTLSLPNTTSTVASGSGSGMELFTASEVSVVPTPSPNVPPTTAPPTAPPTTTLPTTTGPATTGPTTAPPTTGSETSPATGSTSPLTTASSATTPSIIGPVLGGVAGAIVLILIVLITVIVIVLCRKVKKRIPLGTPEPKYAEVFQNVQEGPEYDVPTTHCPAYQSSEQMQIPTTQCPAYVSTSEQKGLRTEAAVHEPATEPEYEFPEKLRVETDYEPVTDLTTWNKTQKVGDREREGKMLLLKERSYGEEESEIETTTF